MSTSTQHAPLGFGLMRLPQAGEQIDIAQTSRMVDAFMAAGFTYFDTAYVYNGSEEAAKPWSSATRGKAIPLPPS